MSVPIVQRVKLRQNGPKGVQRSLNKTRKRLSLLKQDGYPMQADFRPNHFRTFEFRSNQTPLAKVDEEELCNPSEFFPLSLSLSFTYTHAHALTHPHTLTHSLVYPKAIFPSNLILFKLVIDTGCKLLLLLLPHCLNAPTN